MSKDKKKSRSSATIAAERVADMGGKQIREFAVLVLEKDSVAAERLRNHLDSLLDPNQPMNFTIENVQV